MTEEISIDDLAQDIAKEVTPAIVAAIRTGIERGYALGTQNFLNQLAKLTSSLPLPPVAPVVKDLQERRTLIGSGLRWVALDPRC